MLSKIAMAATVFAAGWGTGSGAPCTNAGGDCAAPVHFPGEWPTSIWHSAGGYIRLGVLDLGHLNYDDADGTIGLRYIDHDGRIGVAGTEYDSTSAGCDCEGWGAAYSLADSSRVSGKANDASGVTNVALNGPLMSSAACMDPATHGPATCHEATADARVGCLVVKHHYYPSDKSDFAFNVDVTLMNNCGQDITNLRYARTMDWDIEPNAFNELVYLNPGNAADILCVNDDGFRSGDPDDDLSSGVGRNFDGCAPQGVETDAGVDDHGAQFVFEFQSINATNPLAAGSAHTFRTYYGASHDEASARNEMAKLGDVEAYTLGVYSGPSVGPTHFFGFAGVGGTVVTPPVPDADVLTAPCECTETVVSSSGSQVELRFSEDGPHDAECA